MLSVLMIILAGMRQCFMENRLLPMYHVPPLHVTDEAKGTTGSLQFGTSAVAGAARTSWVQLRAALGAPTPDFSSRFTPEAFSMNEYSRKAAEVFDEGFPSPR